MKPTEKTALQLLEEQAAEAKNQQVAFKGAIIKRILPAIEACAGEYKHEQIVEALNRAGVDFTLRTFRVTLSRARAEVASKAAVS